MKASSRTLGRAGLILGAQLLAILPLVAQTPPAKTVSPQQMPPAVRQAADQFNKAINFQRDKKFPQAIAAYQEYIRLGKIANISPNALVPAYANMATLYGVTGAPKEQAAALREVLKLAPTNTPALADLANLDVSLGRYEEGKAEAEQVLKAKPNAFLTATARFTLGLYYLQKNNMAKAEQEFSASGKLVPTNPQTFMNLAIVYVREKKIPQAISAAETARKVAPKMLQPYAFLASFYRETQQFAKAISVLNGAIALEPTNPRLAFERALLLQQTGDYTNALKGYLNVIEMEPGNSSARLNAGQLYYGIQNFTAAKVQYEEAGKLLPKDVRPLVGLSLSEAQLAMGEPTYLKREAALRVAEERLQRANALSPEHPLVQEALLYVYERANHFEEAQKLVQKRMDREPDKVRNYNDMTRILKAQRRMSDVVALWLKYRLRKPDDRTSYAESADAYELSGKPKEAALEWDALLLRNPNDAQALLQKGRMLLALQQFDESEKQYQKAISVESGAKASPAETSLGEAITIEALRGLSNVSRQRKKYAEAAGYLAKAQAIDIVHSKTSLIPPNLDIMRDLANMYKLADMKQEAIRAFDDLSLYPQQEAYALNEMAKLCDATNNIEQARNAYRRASIHAKDPLSVLLNVGTLYRERQQYAKELEEYNALLPKYGKDSRLHLAFAATYELMQQDVMAAASYKAALSLDPKLSSAQAHLATVYTRMKRYAEAKSIYERLIVAEPLQVQRYADLAQIYSAENQRPAFLAWLQKRFEANPTDVVLFPFFYEEMERQKGYDATIKYLDDLAARRKSERKLMELYADTLANRYKYDKAIQIRQSVADANPTDVIAQMEVVDTLDRSDKKDDATKRLLALCEQKDLPANVRLEFKKRMGKRYLNARKPDEAFPYLLEVAKNTRSDFEAVAIVATMLEKDGRDDEMIPIYKGLLTLKPAPSATFFSDIHKRIARIHAKKGRKAEAIAEYMEALKLNPEDDPSKKEMAALEAK